MFKRRNVSISGAGAVDEPEELIPSVEPQITFPPTPKVLTYISFG
jgi:hypothetical protein